MIKEQATYEAPKYVVALVAHAQAKIARVHWSAFRTIWDGSADPAIEKIGWSVQTLPDASKRTHLSFESVELQWTASPKAANYDMSANVSWSPAEWVSWFDRLMLVIGN
jgi:hypothetical protein